MGYGTAPKNARLRSDGTLCEKESIMTLGRLLGSAGGAALLVVALLAVAPAAYGVTHDVGNNGTDCTLGGFQVTTASPAARERGQVQ